MPLLEDQLQLRGLIMGPGTSYRMVTRFNPFVRTVRADQTGPRAWNHGNWSGAEWAEQAVIPMRMVTLGAGTSGFLPLHQALAAAFAPSSTDLELRFMLAGAEYVMYGRPRMVEPDPRMISGTCYYQLAFIALDPRIYSGVLHTTGAISLPTITGGLQVPFTAPFTVDGATVGGSASLRNAGTTDTGLVFRLDGPVSAPRISLQRPDGSIQTLTINFDLASGDWLDIDTIARTVMLNNFSSRRAQVSGTFPILPQGTSILSFASSTYNASAALTATYRDAWW